MYAECGPGRTSKIASPECVLVWATVSCSQPNVNYETSDDVL